MKRWLLTICLFLCMALPSWAADSYYFGTQETGGVTSGNYTIGISPNAGSYNFGWGYSIRDEFTTALTSGNVNGTAAEPGPGTRTVSDTGNNITITAGGLLSIAGGTSTWGQTKYGLNSFTRSAGGITLAQITPGATTLTSYFSNHSSPTPVGANTPNNQLSFYPSSDGNIYTALNGTLLALAPYAATSYKAALVLRATGGFVMAKGGAYTNWSLLKISDQGNTGTLYPWITTYSGASTHDFLRRPTFKWLPAPLVSDGFSTWGTTDGAGHTESTGLGSGGAGLTWTTRAGTISISSGKAIATALDAVTSRAIATVPVSYLNTYLGAALTKGTTGCGIILRYQDLDNYIYYWHDGTNVKIIKRTGGVDQAAVVSTAVAYSAGKNIEAIMMGTISTCFYNDTAAGGQKTISDATLQTGLAVGLIFFDTDSTIDNFTAYAAGGSENPYAVLDLF